MGWRLLLYRYHSANRSHQGRLSVARMLDREYDGAASDLEIHLENDCET